MQAVFAPKIYGAYYLDTLTKDTELDFFVTFSSMAAVGGNMGQSDYSYANHFMDTYIKRREALQEQGLRSGKSLSLNWSIWANGGMKLDEQMEAFFKNSLGIRPLKSETGIGTFTRGLFAEETQVVVVEGMQERMEIAWGIREKEDEPQTATGNAEAASVATTDEASGEATGLVRQDLIQIVMDFLKLEEDDVAVDKILLDIGFDSIGLASYANALNEKYGLDVITPVLFFEYPSINEITKYLVNEHSGAVANTYNLSGGNESTQATVTAKKAPVKETKAETPAFAGINKGWNVETSQPQAVNNSTGSGLSVDSRFVDCPIAIVGIGILVFYNKQVKKA